MQKDRRHIIFYDGHCALCDGFVTRLLDLDKRALFMFAPLQGKQAQTMLGPEHLPDVADGSLRSVVYWRESRVLIRSDAILAIASDLGGRWRFLSWVGRLVPRGLRDAIYDLVSKHRAKFFGAHESGIQEHDSRRFLD